MLRRNNIQQQLHLHVSTTLSYNKIQNKCLEILQIIFAAFWNIENDVFLPKLVMTLMTPLLKTLLVHM